jgi:hypothetical protein
MLGTWIILITIDLRRSSKTKTAGGFGSGMILKATTKERELQDVK